MIDVHTHCLRHPTGVRREWVDVTPADFDAAMADDGVDLAFVFGMRATRQGVRTPNEFVARFCRDATTPTVGFASLDLSDPDVMDQLAEGVSPGLRGVRLGATPSPAGDPDLVQIIAHLGHPWQRESIVPCRKNRNVCTDLSAAWGAAARRVPGAGAGAGVGTWSTSLRRI